MDKYSKQVTEEAWLICPNWTEVRRFIKNKNNKDKFFPCMTISECLSGLPLRGAT